MSKKGLFAILRILISLSLLALLLWLVRKNFTRIGDLLSSVILPIFILAFLLYLSSLLIQAARLKKALHAQKAALALKDLFSLTLIGAFFTNFMPTSIGGDLIKGYYISKKINTRLNSYAAILMDRILGMFSVALIASITLLVMRRDIEYKFIFWAIALLLAACAIVLLGILNKRIFNGIGKATGIVSLLKVFRCEDLCKRIYNAMNVYATHKRKILQMLILSLISHFICFSAIFLLSKSLSVYLPFSKVLLVMPIIFVLCLLPVTMNGLGLREWGFVFFFSPDMGQAAALSLALLYLALFLLASLIGGIIYLFWR